MKNKIRDNHTYQRELEIRNQYGVHATPAALFVNLAKKYDRKSYSNEVTVEKDGKKVNGKSISGLITLEASQDSRIVLTVKGNGTAKKCFKELCDLVESGFGEN